MRIAIVTAGGAGMFCGSCMHDNTWARSLMGLGLEVTLIPTYTPIRVDEANASLGRVFMGGLNVYLNARWKPWRYVPRFMQRLIDQPWLIRWATQMAVSNEASELGDLTISMLSGEHGPHAAAGAELVQYLTSELRPDVVIFSNALLAGVLPQLRAKFPGPIVCVLQGDDVFLDGLAESYRRQAIDLITQYSQHFDLFLTHTRFYRDYMARYLGLPHQKFQVVPLGIDLTGHTGEPRIRQDHPFTVGYFARIAPEKGLHHLVAAFRQLKDQVPEARLKLGGYLSPHQQGFLDESLKLAGEFRSDVSYVGSPPDHAGKVDFLNSIDVLSVPTEFLEPKGIYVLESLANGIPVVQPAHGSFPELIEATAGGILVPPRDIAALAQALVNMSDPEIRMKYASHGWHALREFHTSEISARRTWELLDHMLSKRSIS